MVEATDSKSVIIVLMPLKDIDLRKAYQKSYIKIHYKANKNKYIEKAKIHNKNYRNRNREYVENIKQNSCCASCGESDFDCLDFHHIEDKTETIARMSYMSCSLKKLKSEIAKCIILCSNCHRKLHASIDQR